MKYTIENMNQSFAIEFNHSESNKHHYKHSFKLKQKLIFLVRKPFSFKLYLN
jgi:hypothetical protein